MADLADVLKDALRLNVDDRAVVAEKLLASLDDLGEEEAERLWAEEAARRREECRAGQAETVDAQDVARRAEKPFR